MKIFGGMPPEITYLAKRALLNIFKLAPAN